MITRNNWIKYQLPEMNVDFKVWFNSGSFQALKFKDAAKYNAQRIAADFFGRDLYVALSGGADSEFVLRTFVEEEIPVIPIIVETPMNNIELQYAAKLTHELKIEPLVIRCNENNVCDYFIDMIYVRCHSKAINSTYHMIATSKVHDLGGIIISGDHIINEQNNAESAAFEYYADKLYKDTHVGFFYYTPEMCYSMVKEIRKDESVADYKARVYGTIWRPKFDPVYSEAVNKDFRDLPEWSQTENGKEWYWHGNKEFLKMMEKYIV